MDSNTALAQLQTFQKTRQNPLDIYNAATTDLGVGDVRSRVNSLRSTLLNTENLLNGVDGSVTGRTQGSLVTDAQRQRLVSLERQPIAAQYGQQERLLGNETTNLNDLTSQAGQRANLAYEGDTQKENSLKSIYDIAAQKEAQARAQAEADRAYQLSVQQFQESQRQFNANMAAANRNAAASRASANAAKPQRDEYNVDLQNLENTLRGYQASGYKGSLPSADSIKSQLRSTYRGIISPREINGYVDTLYKRYYLNPAG